MRLRSARLVLLGAGLGRVALVAAPQRKEALMIWKNLAAFAMLASAVASAPACAGAPAEADDDSSSLELTARQCRTAANANKRACRLAGTVQRTRFRPGDSCIVYLRNDLDGRVYGIVEDPSRADACPLTRAFEGRLPLPFNKVWTRFADTSATTEAEKSRFRRDDPLAPAVAFVRLVGEMHGDLPDEGLTALERSVRAAVSPLTGAKPSLTRSLRVEDAPVAVRSALRALTGKATSRLADTAGPPVARFYAVYESRSRTAPVAYALHAVVTGDDYQHGVVLACDPRGVTVSDQEDSD